MWDILLDLFERQRADHLEERHLAKPARALSERHGHEHVPVREIVARQHRWRLDTGRSGRRHEPVLAVLTSAKRVAAVHDEAARADGLDADPGGAPSAHDLRQLPDVAVHTVETAHGVGRADDRLCGASRGPGAAGGVPSR